MFQVQLLMGAPLAFKHLRHINTREAHIFPDKSLTNGVGFAIGLARLSTFPPLAHRWSASNYQAIVGR